MRMIHLLLSSRLPVMIDGFSVSRYFQKLLCSNICVFTLYLLSMKTNDFKKLNNHIR